MSKQVNVRFREQNKSIVGKLFNLLGFELNTKYQYGYFHQTGYSGNQNSNQHDIAIIEKESGLVITVPNKEKYYKLI